MTASTDSAASTSRTAPRPKPPGRPFRTVQLVTLVVIAALVVGIVAVLLTRGEDATAKDTSTEAPATASGLDLGLDPDEPITVGDGPVEVAIYFDYLCPACGAFEEANGDELDQLIEEGEITVELRPISFLDRLSAGTEYSTRAANALATVVAASPEHVWDFHRALYAQQPAEGGPGLTDEQLADVATGMGVPDAVAADFADRRFDAWTVERTQAAFDDGVDATPTIVLDGELFSGDPYAPGDLTEAVEQAGS